MDRSSTSAHDRPGLRALMSVLRKEWPASAEWGVPLSIDGLPLSTELRTGSRALAHTSTLHPSRVSYCCVHVYLLHTATAWGDCLHTHTAPHMQFRGVSSSTCMHRSSHIRNVCAHLSRCNVDPVARSFRCMKMRVLQAVPHEGWATQHGPGTKGGAVATATGSKHRPSASSLCSARIALIRLSAHAPLQE